MYNYDETASFHWVLVPEGWGIPQGMPYMIGWQEGQFDNEFGVWKGGTWIVDYANGDHAPVYVPSSHYAELIEEGE